jgi:hypothetical protein
MGALPSSRDWTLIVRPVGVSSFNAFAPHAITVSTSTESARQKNSQNYSNWKKAQNID